MDFDDIIAKRKSTRAYNRKNISFRDILDAIDSAIKGPFAGNINNMKYIIIEDAERIKRLAVHAEQPWIADAPAIVIACSHETPLENLYGERGRIYARQQAGAAIMTIILKLTDAGLDTCWVGAFNDNKIKGELGIPPKVNIEALIVIGHGERVPAEKIAKKNKLAEAIYWEVWERSRRATIFQDPLR